jgi:hypothetical protein
MAAAKTNGSGGRFTIDQVKQIALRELEVEVAGGSFLLREPRRDALIALREAKAGQADFDLHLVALCTVEPEVDAATLSTLGAGIVTRLAVTALDLCGMGDDAVADAARRFRD